jgi:hypothetical protein
MTVTFWFAYGHAEVQHLVGEWTRTDLEARAKYLGAGAWEEA